MTRVERRPRIVLSGLTAAGKTTHSRALAANLGVPYFSASELLRSIARGPLDQSAWGHRWAPDIDELRGIDGGIDSEVDRAMLKCLVNSEAGVFDAALLPWIHSSSDVINIWIESDEPSRVRKCYVSHIDNARLSLDEAEAVVRSKDGFSSEVLSTRYDAVLRGDADTFDAIISNSDLIDEPSVAAAAIGAATFAPTVLVCARYLLKVTAEKPKDSRIIHLADS